MFKRALVHEINLLALTAFWAIIATSIWVFGEQPLAGLAWYAHDLMRCLAISVGTTAVAMLPVMIGAYLIDGLDPQTAE